MAAQLAFPSQRFALANGLRATIVHAPDDSRAAVLLRVAAGSHDEPAAFPGLAHFLEHLLFLGGECFSDEQRLMPFVQACGGRLNASTQARSTDFFFELPSAHLEQGLERLLDMLAHPCLDEAGQLREREVLEAEYRARAGDLDTLCDAALARGLTPGHPLADFHAGNRASLAVEQAGFQQALGDFHRRHYQAGQLSLTLLGPQSPAELRRLAERFAMGLPGGAPQARSVPPALSPLRGEGLRLRLPAGPPRLWLAFALDEQPPALEAAVDFFSWLIRDEAPGALLAQLCERGWLDEMRVRLPYQHAGQALLVLDFTLADERAATRERVEAALFDWLAFMAAASWRELLAEYAGQAARRLVELAPLERVREWQRATAGVDEQGIAALFAQLQPQRLIRLSGDDRVAGEWVESAGFGVWLEREPARPPVSRTGDWRFGVADGAGVAASSPVGAEVMLPWLPGPEERGALFLRWRLADAGRASFFALQRALRPVAGAARKRGVELRFTAQGMDWQLTLQGDADALPDVLAATASVLREPVSSACAQGLRLSLAERRRQAGELPIRQLLYALPDSLALGGSLHHTEREATAERIVAGWRQARWDGLLVGLSAERRRVVGQWLSTVPGISQPAGLPPPPLPAGAHRHDLALAGDEHAVLLFCPLADRSAAGEATWRLLARCFEEPFYRRLRSEMQLGYAVFSGFRQVGGLPGLLFAVQSPWASAEQLLGHVDAFLDDSRLLATAPLDDLRRALSSSLEAPVRFPERAEHAWQLHQAGRPHDWPGRLREALAGLTRDDLLAAHQALLASAGGRWMLTSA
ncbi:pyrroloquinoline quinone biosynthesis protein PqqF [Zestomonas carbonaria]|uniref:Coenzyme PQQ synthesis protein F n=1 Tax=Zestomonas carbonaria TaxID=2762745 RepID=A0A7U7EN06_9GAMM|nr:pyrroloquinoline quinone biosynthesis protein PqqF [Pseudomonas carbonaria]CAD5107482.1 hypothetical protein PSEWESI4_01755 [Pseudomonas carbonaria]